MIPIAGAMPRRIPSGIASTIFSLTFKRESIRKITPSIRIIVSAVWKDSTYDAPVSTTIFDTTTAKKLLSPIPGAMANGLLARNAIHIVPMADAIQVAKNTPFQSGEPTSKPVSRLGFKAMI